MDNTLLINLVATLVLGIVSLAALAVLAYASRKGNENVRALLEPYQNIFRLFLGRLDETLAPYGTQLKLPHEVVAAVSSLVDEDSDALAQILPAAIVDAVRVILDQGAALTDGQPPTQETAQPGQFDEAPKS